MLKNSFFNRELLEKWENEIKIEHNKKGLGTTGMKNYLCENWYAILLFRTIKDELVVSLNFNAPFIMPQRYGYCR